MQTREGDIIPFPQDAAVALDKLDLTKAKKLDQAIRRAHSDILDEKIAEETAKLEEAHPELKEPAPEKVVSLETIFENVFKYARRGCYNCVGKGWFTEPRDGAEIKALCNCLYDDDTGAQIMDALEKQAKKEAAE